MQAQHQSSSDPKATTSSADIAQAARHLMAIRIVGTALFEYQVRRTPDSRIRLESLTTMAHLLGDLTATEAAVVAQLLAAPEKHAARATHENAIHSNHSVCQ